MSDITPILRVTYDVIAYDDGGYGDDRSKTFTAGAEAIDYAKSLETRFHPIVMKRITMDPISIQIDFSKD